MNMRGAMISRINDHSGAEYAKQCGHGVDNNLTLGFWGVAPGRFSRISLRWNKADDERDRNTA